MEELLIIRHVLNQFEQHDIMYCHWKSNEHVKEGLCGITDLDILVTEEQHDKVQDLLLGCGFKRFIATFGIRYPGIEDFIGLDGTTGSIIHFHMHFQLTLGEKYLKGYRLPWENTILQTRQWDPENRIYIADPNIEMILLQVRAALKWRLRDRISSLQGKAYFAGDFKKEYVWLLGRIQRSQLQSFCRELLGPDQNRQYAHFAGEAFVMKDFMEFRKLVKKRAAPYKTYPPSTAFFWKIIREFTWKFSVFRKNYLKINIPVRRTLHSGGVIIALIGSDGSGKSTVVRTVVDHFSRKIDATRVYLGSGDGQSSVLRYPIKVTRKFILKSAVKKSSTQAALAKPAGGSGGIKSSPFYRVAKVLWALTLSVEKQQKLKNARKYRERGMLVITDRYPQTQVNGINDGPLLSQWLNHKNRWLRSAAAKEFTAYQGAERMAPDLVIRLKITPEIAFARKQDMSLEEFAKKIDVVNSLTFHTTVVDVDATQPLQNVLLEVKKAIWASM
jgi:thymidylate kinase